jgi:5-oxoprolinase (ATP-hydrolysing) subunit A
MKTIDLNCDMGESYGAWKMGADEEVMPHITSANVACGFHAGDPGVMRATVELARDHGVAVGAHPGFADLAGFGRREMHLSPREVEDLVAYQIGALAAIAAGRGVRLQHVKAHGALYNMAARDEVLADAIARAVVSVDRSLVLVGLRESALIAAGSRAGLRTAAEAFADRAYRPDGSLLPRTEPGAVIHDPDRVVARVPDLAGPGVDTICVHGDTPGAAALAGRVRAALEAAGVTVSSLGAPPPAPA